MKHIQLMICALIIAIIFYFLFVFLFPPKIAVPELLLTYSKEEITYFAETAFEQKGGSIIRWADTIRVSLTGTYSLADSLELVKIIKEVSPLINVEIILFTGQSSNANLLINLFKSQKDYDSNTALSDQDNMAQGVTKYDFRLMSNEIIGAKIFVFHFAADKYWTLRHEFCHALGLPGHSKRRTNDRRLLAPIIFENIEDSDKWSETSHYFPEADKKSIKLLYDKELPIGLKISDFQKAVSLI